MQTSDLLSTPGNYATPAQIQAVNEYAKALGTTQQQGTITHPLQGVSNMVNALMGGWLTNRSAQMERAARQTDARSMPMAPGGSVQSTEDSDKKAITSVESGGNYGSVGPQTRTGDHAYGRYQIMGSNVVPWTKEVLGQEMSPQDFLQNKEAQDRVFAAKFGQLKEKYGSEGAARAWFAGEGGMNDMNRKDSLGTSVADYSRRFQAAGGGGPQPVPAMSSQFQGADAPPMSSSPAQSAIVSALSGGARAQPQPQQPGMPAQVAQQPAPGQQPMIQPGLVPQRPQINRQQFETLMSSSWLPQSEKDKIQEMYLQQFQPLSVPFTGGNIVVSPTHPGTQQFIPQLNMVPFEAGAGGANIKTQVPSVMTPQGTFQALPQQGQPPLPRPAAPSGPSTPSAAPSLEGLPNMLQYAPTDQGAAAGPQVPDKVPPFAPQADAKPPTQGPQVAQYLPPGTNETLNQLIDIGANAKARETEATQRAEQYQKAYQDRNKSAEIAIRSIPQIKMAKRVIEDPKFISGFMADPRLDLARLKSFMAPYLGTDPQAAAPTEFFDKLMSGNILEDMKVMLQGLGQVRVAEINLLSKATGNRYNTLPANRAVIDIMMRTHQLAGTIGQMSSAYAQGVRWDPKTGKPYQAFNHPTGLDYGWDQTMQQYMQHHPLFNDQEVENYNKMLDTGNPQPNEASAKYGGVEGIDKTLTDAAHGGAGGTPNIVKTIDLDGKTYSQDSNGKWHGPTR